MIIGVIMRIVEDVAIQMSYDNKAVVHLQRYFLRLMCTWLTLKQIAEATNCTHTAVIHSFRAVDTEPRFREIKKLLKEIKTKSMTELKENLQGRYDFTAPQRSLTKEELYDKIGQCNVRIVELEENIHLLEQLGDAMNSIKTSVSGLSLSEAKTELDYQKEIVRQLRMTLVVRMEIDREEVQKRINQAHLYNLEKLEAHKDRIQKEIDTLSKLI